MKLSHPKIAKSGAVRRKNRGAALVVGLMLLMVITLLAISSMRTSTLELQMAGNMQFAQRANIAADMGIENALSNLKFSDVTDTIAWSPVVSGSVDKYTSTTRWVQTTDALIPPGGTEPAAGAGVGGGSIGESSGQSLYHYELGATGSSSRNASATATQGFYIKGPKSSVKTE